MGKEEDGWGNFAGNVPLGEEDWSGSFLLVELGGEVVASLWRPPYRVLVEGKRDGPLARPRTPAGRGLDPDVVRAGRPNVATVRRAYDLIDLVLFRGPRWQPT